MFSILLGPLAFCYMKQLNLKHFNYCFYPLLKSLNLPLPYTLVFFNSNGQINGWDWDQHLFWNKAFAREQLNNLLLVLQPSLGKKTGNLATLVLHSMGTFAFIYSGHIYPAHSIINLAPKVSPKVSLTALKQLVWNS